MIEPFNNDIDGDGVIEQDEVDIVKKRVATHRTMAIFAMIALVGSGGYIVAFADPSQIEAYGSALDLFWITLGGIIATYMGAEIWASK